MTSISSVTPNQPNFPDIGNAPNISPNMTDYLENYDFDPITIAADDTVYAANIDFSNASFIGRGPYVYFTPNTSITNDGDIWIEDALGLWADVIVNNGELIIDSSGQAIVALTSLQNTGLIAVQGAGEGFAGGVSTQIQSFGDEVVILNSGTIAVTASASSGNNLLGGAAGVSSSNGGRVLNDVGGEILVSADTYAVGVTMGRGQRMFSEPLFAANRKSRFDRGCYHQCKLRVSGNICLQFAKRRDGHSQLGDNSRRCRNPS